MKHFTILFVILIIIFTVSFCIVKPKMHKTFQLNIIEYVLKFNNDGSMTTTKQVTTTNLKRDK